MHARYRSPLTSRFLSTDPAGGEPGLPQSWNAYAYVQGRPLLMSDPTGMVTAAAIATGIQASLQDLRQGTMSAVSTGGVGGIVAATAIGSALDLASLATDALKAGDSLGTAVGSGAGAGEVAIAAGQDALRTTALVAPLAMAGRSVASRLGARMLDDAASGLGNPFRGKNASQIDEMFQQKGFEARGPDPVNGKGGYVNPRTGRSYHIDEANSFGEAPHVDVNRPRGYKGELEKKKYSTGG